MRTTRALSAIVATVTAGLLAGCHSVDAPIIEAKARDAVIAQIERTHPGVEVTGFRGEAGCCDSGTPGLHVKVLCECARDTEAQRIADDALDLVWRTYEGPVENEVVVSVSTLPAANGIAAHTGSATETSSSTKPRPQHWPAETYN